MNASVIIPAPTCRVLRRITAARIGAEDAAARAAAIESAARAAYTAAREDWKGTFPAAWNNGADVELPPETADMLDTREAHYAAMDAAAAAEAAAEAAAAADAAAEAAAARGDWRAVRDAARVAIRAERTARAA